MIVLATRVVCIIILASRMSTTIVTRVSATHQEIEKQPRTSLTSKIYRQPVIRLFS